MLNSGLSNTVTELDLALLNALQLSPRADWNHLANALDITPATAARRWDALEKRGLAWVGITIGRRREENISSALALVTCHGNPADVAELLALEPEIATMSRTAGRHHLLLDILVPDLEELRHYLAHRLPMIDGVASVVSFPITSIYTTGSSWRVQALDSAQVRRINGGKSPGSRPSVSGLDELDRALVVALTNDARMAWAELAAICRTSAPTARRRVQRLIEMGTIEFRCEMATPLVGPAVKVTFLLELPAGSLAEVGRQLASMPKCRFAATLIDRSNMVATMWFAGPSEIDPFEAMLLTMTASVNVVERIVHLVPVKRIGHLLDSHDRATGIVVPLAAWE